MEPFHHTMSDLLQQLGVGSSDKEVIAFLETHKLLKQSTQVQYADCFTDHQKAFLQQAYQEDADWVSLIEQLDIMLRSPSQ